VEKPASALASFKPAIQLIGLPLTVQLKTEPDGRMFPITDNSETIVDCLTKAASLSGVAGAAVERVSRQSTRFEISLKSGEFCSVLVYSRHQVGYQIAKL